MAIPLKQSTASQEIPLGHFVDDTDGKTAETGLTIANTDIKLWKTGATTLANKNSGGATHISGGIYYAVLDATDTDTLGPLVAFVHVSGALPVRVECCVYAANVYDSLIAASDKLQTDAVEISSDSTAADNLETAFDNTAGSVPQMGIVDQGTAQSATSTTLVLRSAAAFADDEIVGATIVITGGTGAGQSRVITDYVSSTDTATVDAWTTTPSGTITYKIYASAPGSTGSPVPANVVQISGDSTAADNLEAAADGTGYNLGGGSIVAASVTGNVGGNVTGSVGSLATQAKADVNAEVDTAISDAALATAANLATVDTVADAIKAKTDSLTFTKAGEVDANIQSINGTTVNGDGSATPWGP